MIGIIGSGTWATAIVKILLEQPDRHINWWVRSPEIREGIARDGHNPKYLSSVDLDASRLHVSGDLSQVVAESEYLFLVTPSAYIAQVLEQLPRAAYKGKKFISATKGIIPPLASPAANVRACCSAIPTSNALSGKAFWKALTPVPRDIAAVIATTSLFFFPILRSFLENISV